MTSGEKDAFFMGVLAGVVGCIPGIVLLMLWQPVL